MILITTAGKVGSAAAQRLVELGVPVRVLARNREKAVALAQAGVDVFHGDLDDSQSVEEAFRGVSGVVLVTAPVVSQELRVIDNAKRADVGHIVKITTKATANSSIARRRNHVAIEDALISSGLPHTFLRNNAYMQNFLMAAPAIAETSSFRTAAGDGRVGYVDARDVAAVAAEVAAAPAGHVGKTYWPTGPEALSADEVAGVLTKVTGRKVTFQPITYEEQKQAMISVGVPEHIAEDNARAVALMAEGDCDFVTDDVAELLGRPATSFEQFATGYAKVFA
ncbi:NmrA family NAD(P)-binding protein [Streptomyces aurantiacus]|uniref:Nucleotide-diphosphate-sugar epimerase n=1 Tax=Streptomyces aurantiacus TaxID=47760 RepID=A0A7G1NVF0_9ACTN|nr:NmrA family NAD(P)-binding protein [Streptomyces aurantiacus]BCL25567.1 nucleotide-diphosphate-sugar epimerase [Streptomyces aurantiacus]